MKRILLSAYQCAPGAGSVSQIGWEWYSRLATRMQVTLATHVRNRAMLEAAGAPLPNTSIIYIDTEWLARPLYRLSKQLFRNSEHSVFLLSSLDFFAFDAALVRQARQRMRQGAQWDLVHAVTPVSPSAFTRLGVLGLPLVRGPLNGGLRTPSQFPELMKADSAWLYSLRNLTRPLRALLGRRAAGSVVLAANDATRESLTRREREVARTMMEIAVDPAQFTATPWPSPPSRVNPLRLVFVGRLIPAKALSLLLDAISELRDQYPVHLTVIGDGPMRDQWQHQAVPLGDAVTFTGAQGASFVAAAIEQSHALCLPSVRESGGAVLLEAMSCGRPVIGIAHGGPGGIITPDIGSLVHPKNTRAVIDGLKDTFRDIFANPDAWSRRGRNGRTTAENVHSWDARIHQFSALYDELVPAAAAGASQ
jgi:glycosyltransferase involved in cell wall biosynthesis